MIQEGYDSGLPHKVKKEFILLSSDTKPITVEYMGETFDMPAMSTCLESDTGDIYVYHNGWVKL